MAPPLKLRRRKKAQAAKSRARARAHEATIPWEVRPGETPKEAFRRAMPPEVQADAARLITTIKWPPLEAMIEAWHTHKAGRR